MVVDGELMWSLSRLLDLRHSLAQSFVAAFGHAQWRVGSSPDMLRISQGHDRKVKVIVMITN